MKTNNNCEITLKIKIKSLKKPIIVILNNENTLNSFLERLKRETIIKLGNIVFSVNEFEYATINL